MLTITTVIIIHNSFEILTIRTASRLLGKLKLKCTLGNAVAFNAEIINCQDKQNLIKASSSENAGSTVFLVFMDQDSHTSSMVYGSAI